MIVYNKLTKKYYELSRAQASRMIGVSASTLFRQEFHKRVEAYVKNDFKVIFAKVHRIKQAKGNHFKKK